MGITKSITYDISDPEAGEESEIIKLEFKAQTTGPKDYIIEGMKKVGETKLVFFMQGSSDFPNLNAAYTYIL